GGGGPHRPGLTVGRAARGRIPERRLPPGNRNPGDGSGLLVPPRASGTSPGSGTGSLPDAVRNRRAFGQATLARPLSSTSDQLARGDVLRSPDLRTQARPDRDRSLAHAAPCSRRAVLREGAQEALPFERLMREPPHAP